MLETYALGVSVMLCALSAFWASRAVMSRRRQHGLLLDLLATKQQLRDEVVARETIACQLRELRAFVRDEKPSAILPQRREQS